MIKKSAHHFFSQDSGSGALTTKGLLCYSILSLVLHMALALALASMPFNKGSRLSRLEIEISEPLQVPRPEPVARLKQTMRIAPKKVVELNSHPVDSAAARTPASVPADPPADTQIDNVQSNILLNYRSRLWAAIESIKQYPALARERRQTGVVKVGFTLKKNGLVTNVHVLESCDHELLNQAALNTLIRLGQFDPIPDSIAKEEWDISISLRYKLD